MLLLVAHLVTGHHHIPGILSGCQSWSLLKHINGQKRACVKAAKQLCDDLHWSVAQNRSIVQLYSWKSQHFTTHCQERNAACFSPPKFLQQLCYDFEDIAQLRVPRTYLFTCHCHHPWHWVRRSHQLWKAWFSLPVFSYKLSDTGFRKICQEIKIQRIRRAETDCRRASWEQGSSQEILEYIEEKKSQIFLVFPYVRGKYSLT